MCISFGKGGNQPSPQGVIPFEDVKYDEANGEVTIKVPPKTVLVEALTRSMDPLADEGHIIFQTSHPPLLEISAMIPGDIIAFETVRKYGGYMQTVWINHRIVEIKTDNDGLYCRTRGDNNKKKDKEKIRQNMIKYRSFSVIWTKPRI